MGGRGAGTLEVETIGDGIRERRYYVYKGPVSPVSTLMRCPSRASGNEFISVPLEANILEASPDTIFVYAPAELEVRYQVWKLLAGEEGVAVQR